MNNNGIATIPPPYNEPVKSYARGSEERRLLKAELARQMETQKDIPLVINGKPVETHRKGRVVCPHDHQHVLAKFSMAGETETARAIEAALAAKKGWETLHWQDRAAIFLKAAELISQKYTYLINAATMLGQSKTAFQAEIEATCEMADFLRFNVKFMEEIYSGQPLSEKGIWNRLEYRPLEGFIFALSPFNFTAIAGNLCTAPAMMGNTVVWKPSSRAVLSGFYLMEIFREAGLPDGVINFVPGRGATIGKTVMAHKDLGGIHFTGSTTVFQTLWQKVGENIAAYKSYPRLVGETGGKDFIFMHPSADTDAVVTAAVRGAYEYQGQKCSAASRMYVPRSRWRDVKSGLLSQIDAIRTGSVQAFGNFVNAVIDEAAFDSINGYILRACASDRVDILAGGPGDKTRGYFIAPTLILTEDPEYETMTEEIFGPVLTVYVYEDEAMEETLELVDTASVYALTGAVFARDRRVIAEITGKLSHAAGNFYINDKPTGAVVGQQPFGGARASGTNDKAGSLMNLIRWTSPRSIKEAFVPPADFRYPFMEE